MIFVCEVVSKLLRGAAQQDNGAEEEQLVQEIAKIMENIRL